MNALAPSGSSSVFTVLSSVPHAASLQMACRPHPAAPLYPPGTPVSVEFGHTGEDVTSSSWIMRVVLPDGSSFFSRRIQGFFDVPSLEEAHEEELSESVLGESVEPDGFDDEGSPSWLVALGLV